MARVRVREGRIPHTGSGLGCATGPGCHGPASHAIHRSAWKGHSQQIAYEILHKAGPLTNGKADARCLAEAVRTLGPGFNPSG
jgi:hypothetical protein